VVVVTVTKPANGSGSGIPGDLFTYTAPAPATPVPTVTGISPSSGPTAGGTTVIITGSGFTGATGVSFGSVAATGFAVVNDTTITATSPAESAGAVDVTVNTPGGASATSPADRFTYTAAAPATPAPTVTSINPNSGPTTGGTPVTITGANFTGATSVMFGSTAATGVTVNNGTSISATSPAGTGTVDITVTTPAGISATSSADQFTYTTTTPAASQTVLVFTIGSTDYTVNGQAQTMDTPPIISGGRTLLPIRYVSTPLNATVNWDPSQQMVKVSLNSNTIDLWIGQNIAQVNGTATPIDSTNSVVAPIIVNGRTMLPMRFIAESLGCQVNWDPSQQMVTVTYPQP
jgi:hypothetical protein